jgi:hypothetical protein
MRTTVLGGFPGKVGDCQNIRLLLSNARLFRGNLIDSYDWFVIRMVANKIWLKMGKYNVN